MATNDRCVFCGKPVGGLRSTNVLCGSIYQCSCRDCAREMEPLDHADRCRRALLRGLADRPEKLQTYLRVQAEAEEHRPKCTACGGRMIFMPVQHFDNTPHSDSLFHGSFQVLPAWCESCARFEFFNPAAVQKNPFLAHLMETDSEKT